MTTPVPTQQAMGMVRVAIQNAKRVLAKTAAGSQDEANVTKILASLEPLALEFPVAKVET